MRNYLIYPEGLLVSGWLLVVFSLVAGVILGILHWALRHPVMILPVWLALGSLFIWLVSVFEISLRRSVAKGRVRALRSAPHHNIGLDRLRELEHNLWRLNENRDYWNRHFWASLILPWALIAIALLAWLLIPKPATSGAERWRESAWMVFGASLLTDIYLGSFFRRASTIEYKKRLEY